jgi:hypothetical protein
MQQQMQQQSKGFFARLFDFSFRDFITPTIISILYGIMMVLAGIVAIGFIVYGFTQGVGLGIVFLILSPLIFLLYVIYSRVILEMMVALVRIAQNTTDMLRKQ